MITNNLKAILKTKKVPVKQLAKAVGVSKPYIYKLEHITNKGSYNVENLNEVCDYLHVSLKELLSVSSGNLIFKIIPKYSRIIHNSNGCAWIHTVLNAYNPKYYGKARNVGYFNFESRATTREQYVMNGDYMSGDYINVDYQASKSINLHIPGKHPVNKSYLTEILHNKRNLINCAILSIKKDYNFVLKNISNGAIIGTDYPVALRLSPVWRSYVDPDNYILNFYQLKQICCNIFLANEKSKFHNKIKNICPIINGHVAMANKNNSYDNAIFGIPRLNNGGNFINQKIYNKKLFKTK